MSMVALKSFRFLVAIMAGSQFTSCSPREMTEQQSGTVRSFALSPGTVAVAQDTSKVTITYSVLNGGSSIVPARSYEIEFYLDAQLASFDRATGSVLPHSKTVYTFSQKVVPGRHTYRLVLRWPHSSRQGVDSIREKTGEFEIP
jgi:hypothetical protein